MTAKKKSPLPGIVYVYEETDGDTKFLVASRTAAEAVDTAGPRLVGKYWLGQEHTVELKVKSTRVRR